jgi:hypothetical protein
MSWLEYSRIYNFSVFNQPVVDKKAAGLPACSGHHPVAREKGSFRIRK